MFQGNLLTFNPGWDENAMKVEDYDDIRAIQKSLMAQGVTFPNPVDESTSGPANTIITDPDGNVILLDQHV